MCASRRIYAHGTHRKPIYTHPRSTTHAYSHVCQRFQANYPENRDPHSTEHTATRRYRPTGTAQHPQTRRLMGVPINTSRACPVRGNTVAASCVVLPLHPIYIARCTLFVCLCLGLGCTRVSDVCVCVRACVCVYLFGQNSNYVRPATAMHVISDLLRCVYACARTHSYSVPFPPTTKTPPHPIPHTNPHAPWPRSRHNNTEGGRRTATESGLVGCACAQGTRKIQRSL